MAARKPKPKVTAKWKTRNDSPAWLWAIKTKRAGCNVDWMPTEVVLHLEGGDSIMLLDYIGWSVSGLPAWPRDRIEGNLLRLREIWKEDFGAGWRLEIREVG